MARTSRSATPSSGKDLTRSVLLQIIAEHEEHGQPMLSTQLLTGIIGFYGDELQGFMGPYLEHSMQVFIDQQQQFLRKDLASGARMQLPGMSLDALIDAQQRIAAGPCRTTCAEARRPATSRT